MSSFYRGHILAGSVTPKDSPYPIPPKPSRYEIQ